MLSRTKRKEKKRKNAIECNSWLKLILSFPHQMSEIKQINKFKKRKMWLLLGRVGEKGYCRYEGEHRQRQRQKHLGASWVNRTLSQATWGGEERTEKGEGRAGGQKTKKRLAQPKWLGYTGKKSSWGKGSPGQFRVSVGYASQEDPVTKKDWRMLGEPGGWLQLCFINRQLS